MIAFLAVLAQMRALPAASPRAMANMLSMLTSASAAVLAQRHAPLVHPQRTNFVPIAIGT